MGPAVNMIDEARSFARKDWKICYAAWLYTSRGISIWKIGRASIGMEISSVTEPTIINLGKQCAETKEYFFFFLFFSLSFSTMFECTTRGCKLRTTRVHVVQRAKYDPLFSPLFYFLLSLSPFFPSIFLFLVPSSSNSGRVFVRAPEPLFHGA